MVRLLPQDEIPKTEMEVGFNPTMVRLLLVNPEPEVKEVKRFNPTMVRLLLIRHKTRYRISFEVSIPQWCDCCANNSGELRRTILGFNPTMVRLLRSIRSASSILKYVSIPQWCDCCCWR